LQAPEPTTIGRPRSTIPLSIVLNFFDDEAYRRRILVQLNRGEGRHMLSRNVFHGKRGELRPFRNPRLLDEAA
jgi:TnpA family transposase